MKLAEYLDTEKLRRHINNGFVTGRKHHTLPLTIFCYTRKAVSDRRWDDVTTKTRGLIVDDAGEIIARPYEKFFSLDQLPTSVDIKSIDTEFGPPVITEKVNGSLGIFWKHGTHWGIASKGSFHSLHADFATKWMEQHVEEHGPLVFPEGYTPVFEIICQEIQPHVIKYERDGLVLLNFVNTNTGEEGDRREVTNYYSNLNRLEKTLLTDFTLEEALGLDKNHYEGLVATYNIPGQAPFKLKIKFPTFLKNRKTFYEEQKRQEVPNQEAYNGIFNMATSILQEALVICTTRKEFAEYFNKPEHKEYAPVCFSMMDEENYKKVIWRIVNANRCREGNTESTTVRE